MLELLFRYGSLTVLTFIVLFQSYAVNGSIVSLIIILTILLLSYFLIPVLKKPLINYIIISSVIPVSAVLNHNMEYLLLLLSFFLIEGSLNLTTRNFYIFSSYSMIVFIVIAFFSYLPINSLLLIILFVICASFLHHAVIENKEKKELYEQLLLQYRKLKRLSVEQEELVRAEERTKIARDMHDSVGHKLTALLMQLEVMDLQNESRSILQNVKSLARESLEETRFAVHQLKSSETTGIQSVIQLIRKLEMESHLMIKFTLEKGILSIPLSNAQSIVLYRVLQESLTNAMKHSESKEVEVILAMNSLQQVQFFVKNKVFSHYPIILGFGLTNMKERLQEIGGDLRINNTNQQFIVEGTFPLRRED
ncbi:sensor histidine kinase [Ureibacillus manganicus]|nr:histidine kinase [Ureibacillus manganicus]